MQELDSSEIIKNYDSIQNIWQSEDRWHLYTHIKIRQFLKKMSNENEYQNKKILNAGSGGQAYCFPEENMFHIDLTDKKIKEKERYVIGDIQSMPYDNSYFELVLCVGEVINYCDALRAIKELSRVLKVGGELVLEYESSKTLELLFKKEFNSSSVLQRTFYQGRPENLWYFSENYINQLLMEVGLKINAVERFHQLSPLFYRFSKSSNISAKFARLDSVARFIPWINRCASNVIILATKIR